MNTTGTQAIITPDQAAEMFKLATTSATKWAFLDGVASMVDAQPFMSQREVVDQIGDTPLFIGMHGHHRDKGDAGRKAASKLKSIRDELSVVKVWAPADRVDGVSFESHKVLNRLGSSAGKKILTTLVKEMGGPGNVTKSAVVARLKVADPDHVPQKNGKVAAPAPITTAGTAGNHVVTPLTLTELANQLASQLTVGDLSKDTALADAVMKVADIYEAFAQRKQAKAAASTGPVRPAHGQVAPKRPTPKRPGVKAPAARPQRATAKPPVVKAPI